jgi:metal-sulfur cluster biosynthetic enzyme
LDGRLAVITSPTLNESTVREALREVYDPELGVNVVDLGLIYSIAVEAGAVHLTMTLTTPGCPLHASMVEAVESAVWTFVPGVESVEVELVWEPAWTVERLSPDGRKLLGLG